MATDLNIEIDNATVDRLERIALSRRRTVIEVVKDAIAIYADAHAEPGTVTVGIELPASTVAMWTTEAARHGRTAEKELEIRVLMETIRLGNEAIARAGR